MKIYRYEVVSGSEFSFECYYSDNGTLKQIAEDEQITLLEDPDYETSLLAQYNLIEDAIKMLESLCCKIRKSFGRYWAKLYWLNQVEIVIENGEEISSKVVETLFANFEFNI